MNFFQILKIFWARRWIFLAATITCVAVTAVVVSLLPRQYVARAQFIFDLSRGDPITGRSVGKDFIGAFAGTQYELLRSERVTGPVVDRLQLTQNPGFIEAHEQSGSNLELRTWIARRLRENITITPQRRTNIVEISFMSPDPSYTAEVANTVLDVFRQVSAEFETSANRQDADWFDVQLRTAREALRQAEAAEMAFRTSNGLSPQGDGLEIERQRLANLAGQMTSSAGMIMPIAPVAPSRAAISASSSALRAQLLALNSQLAQLQERLGPAHPTVQALESNRANLQQQIAQEESLARSADDASRAAAQASISAQAAAARASQGAIRSAYEQQRARIQQLSGLMEELSQLQRTVEQRRSEVEVLAQRASMARLQTEAPDSSIVPLSRAERPQRATFPDVRTALMLAAGFGALLGLLLSLIAELLDRRVRGHEDVEYATNAPVLAIMPTESNRVVALWRRLTEIGKSRMARSLPSLGGAPILPSK
jgi:polysaccharide biosynthesis transport protein